MEGKSNLLLFVFAGICGLAECQSGCDTSKLSTNVAHKVTTTVVNENVKRQMSLSCSTGFKLEGGPAIVSCLEGGINDDWIWRDEDNKAYDLEKYNCTKMVLSVALAGVAIPVIIVLFIAMVVLTVKKKKTSATGAGRIYETTIRDMAGDTNLGYEAPPLPPVNVNLEHSYAGQCPYQGPKTNEQKQTSAMETGRTYETTIRDMAGDENQCYEAPTLPPVNLDLEHSYATSVIPQALDGNQGQGPYQGLKTNEL